MNGVAIGPDSRKNIDALKKADWLVVGEIYPDETSEFWKSPGITTDEMKQIQTTVYRLPCAGFAEKDGTFTNSARWLQWKNAALPMPGDCRLDQAIVAQIFLKVRELYKKDPGKFPDPILKLTWAYTDPPNPSLAEVLKEINGKALADLEDPATKQQIKAGQQLPGFAWLKDDGTTACGNWIYSGSYTEAGNLTARRDPSDPSNMGVHQNWGWSWPANRRVLYNRASCDLDGKPWDPSRRQVWWNEATQKWAGNDVPDFKADSKPKDHMGPFIMNAEGVGRIFAPLAAFADGPFPGILRTDGKPHRKSAAPAANPQSRGQALQDSRRQVRLGQRRLHRNLHDLSPHRALSLLDEEQSHERATRPRAVHRDRRGNGRRNGYSRRRETESLQRSRRLHRQSHGHQAHQGR